MKVKPQFLLDECMSVSEDEEKNETIFPFRKFAYPGTIDDVLLEKATKAGLVLITRDKGLVLLAISYGINIVYQNKWGQRYYVYGSKTKYMGKIDTKGIFEKSNLQKKKELLASATSRMNMFGLDQMFCI